MKKDICLEVYDRGVLAIPRQVYHTLDKASDWGIEGSQAESLSERSVLAFDLYFQCSSPPS